MHALCGPLATLAVASIFYAYKAYMETRRKRQQILHERVAYMLWTAAQRAED
jgi:hypothetical protein